MENKETKKGFFNAIFLGAELGFLIAIPLILFLLGGVFLDRKFDSLPFFILVSLFLGGVAAFFNIRYLILPFLERKVGQSKKEKV